MKKRDLIITILILLLAFFLRTYKFMSTPNSLYWEEIALGYDAWSIAETGRDYHNNWWPVVAFESFGDYKPSGYFYILALFIKIFGPYDWVIKIPSLFAGVFIVYASGRLLKLLLVTKKEVVKEKMSYFLMFLLAINPALIHLSRIGFETNLALAFLLAGLIFLFKVEVDERKWWLDLNLIGGEILLIFSFYTYHSMRVVAPLLGLIVVGWSFFSFREKKYHRYWFFNLGVMLLLGLFCLWPFLRIMGDEEITNRFNETSIFADLEMIKASNQCREIGSDTMWARIYCHRYLYFGQRIIQNALSHFNFNYLFLSGDDNRRHSIGLFGLFYPLDLLPLLVGLWWMKKNYKQEKKLVMFLILAVAITLLPVSLTLATPHLLRSLGLVVWLSMLIVGGWWGIRELIVKIDKKVFWGGVLVLYLCQLSACQWYYNNYYVKEHDQWWQYGYKEAIEELALLQAENSQWPVYVTRELGRPSIYYFWYNKINPVEVQKLSEQEKYDQGEFLTYKEISFGGLKVDKKQLVVLSYEEAQRIPKNKLQITKKILNQKNEIVLIVGKIIDENMVE